MAEKTKEPGTGAAASRMGWIVSANLLAVLALGLAVAALVFHFTDEDGGGSSVVQATPTASPTATPPVVVAGVSADNAPSWGPQDAPVTIVEFSDFL
jgi:hypothetical protein